VFCGDGRRQPPGFGLLAAGAAARLADLVARRSGDRWGRLALFLRSERRSEAEREKQSDKEEESGSFRHGSIRLTRRKTVFRRC